MCRTNMHHAYMMSLGSTSQAPLSLFGHGKLHVVSCPRSLEDDVHQGYSSAGQSLLQSEGSHHHSYRLLHHRSEKVLPSCPPLSYRRSAMIAREVCNYHDAAEQDLSLISEFQNLYASVSPLSCWLCRKAGRKKQQLDFMIQQEVSFLIRLQLTLARTCGAHIHLPPC